MNFLSDNERRISKNFLTRGYSVLKIKERKSLNFIHSLILKSVKSLIGKKNFSILILSIKKFLFQILMILELV